jgi:hypothetical protein
VATQQFHTADKNLAKIPKGNAVLRSSRLAARLATMDKVKLVLLKKDGIDADDANHKDVLKKYNDIYKQQQAAGIHQSGGLAC